MAQPFSRNFALVDLRNLEAVAAGTPGWLDNHSLVVCMNLDCIAFAKSRTLVILGLPGVAGSSNRITPSANFINMPASDAEDRVTAMQWLVWEGWSALAVGMKSGVLLVYSLRGSLLTKQNFHSGSILQLRLRSSRKNHSSRDVTEELTVVLPRSIIRLDAVDLQSQLRRRMLETEKYREGVFHRIMRSATQDTEADFGTLTYQIWNISKTSSNNACADAAITGVLPPPLFEQQTSQRYFCAVTVGTDSAMSSFRLSEDKSNSLREILFSKIVPATMSSLSSLTKALWRTEDTSPARPVDVKPQEFGRASLITTLKDSPRKGERLAVSPSGSLAAITDSLGRVLLLDVLAHVIVRLWKGYRDAYCMFLEAPLDGNTGLPSSENAPQETKRSVKKNFCLCLAIHAPRRGVIEIWRLRNGPRVSVIRYEGSCRLLQPASKLWTSNKSSVTDQNYEPSVVILFNGNSGQLSLLNPFALMPGS